VVVARGNDISTSHWISLSHISLFARVGRGWYITLTGSGEHGDPITTDDLGVSGALAVLMKDAVKPNLMQTLQVWELIHFWLSICLNSAVMQDTSVFIPAGPFANIAHGNASILANHIALKLAGPEEGNAADCVGYILIKGRFGADMGMEKFCNIKCRVSSLKPNATVIVATTQALKMHSGGPDVTPRKPLHETYTNENLAILGEGCKNLVRHIQNRCKFGIKVVIGINQFLWDDMHTMSCVHALKNDDHRSDTPAELELICQKALKGGADAAVVSSHWAKGRAGTCTVAEAVIATCEGPSAFKPLYDLALPIEDKIAKISREIYGADGIELSELARKQLETYTRPG
jgi:methylenetetrahydrofolate dehydrogenase (NADP+)/methenyltetrahydrofolate cyclohydrolase/formyltetrahydrofolate synthetase